LGMTSLTIALRHQRLEEFALRVLLSSSAN
jgi:hypothetical protein